MDPVNLTQRHSRRVPHYALAPQEPPLGPQKPSEVDFFEGHGFPKSDPTALSRRHTPQIAPQEPSHTPQFAQESLLGLQEHFASPLEPQEPPLEPQEPS